MQRLATVLFYVGLAYGTGDQNMHTFPVYSEKLSFEKDMEPIGFMLLSNNEVLRFKESRSSNINQMYLIMRRGLCRIATTEKLIIKKLSFTDEIQCKIGDILFGKGVLGTKVSDFLNLRTVQTRYMYDYSEDRYFYRSDKLHDAKFIVVSIDDDKRLDIQLNFPGNFSSRVRRFLNSVRFVSKPVNKQYELGYYSCAEISMDMGIDFCGNVYWNKDFISNNYCLNNAFVTLVAAIDLIVSRDNEMKMKMSILDSLQFFHSIHEYRSVLRNRTAILNEYDNSDGRKLYSIDFRLNLEKPIMLYQIMFSDTQSEQDCGKLPLYIIFSRGLKFGNFKLDSIRIGSRIIKSNNLTQDKTVNLKFISKLDQILTEILLKARKKAEDKCEWPHTPIEYTYNNIDDDNIDFDKFRRIGEGPFSSNFQFLNDVLAASKLSAMESEYTGPKWECDEYQLFLDHWFHDLHNYSKKLLLMQQCRNEIGNEIDKIQGLRNLLMRAGE